MPINLKAQRVAQNYAHSQAELDKLLAQFGPAHRRAMLERLRPHLKFSPRELPREFHLHLDQA